MVSQRILMLVLSYHLQSDICAQELAGNNTCADKDGTSRCCPGFLLLDGECRALECLGAYGENCTMPCGPNTYGYRCRRACHCVQNQVCDKYTGCMDREFWGLYGDGVEHPDTILALLIGLGSLSISMSLVFVGVMFWRWRIHIQRKIRAGDKNTTGFQVNMLSVPGMEEGYTETYDDVRESKMIVHAGNSGPRDTGQCRINSTEYDTLFNDEKVSKKTTHEEQYNTIDACSQRDNTFVTLSDFPYDDCYVSVSQNAKRLRRISKSCSDVMAVLEKPYINIISRCNAKSSKDNYDKDALIEHL